MCGIAAILHVKEQTHELRDKALKMSQKIRHRGPDWSGIYCGGSAILAHERLSIVDPESGGQPLYSPDKKQVLAVNGEIYNHQEIRRREERVPHCPRPHRCHPPLYRLRQRRHRLCGLRTESPRRSVRALRTLPARTLLLEP